MGESKRRRQVDPSYGKVQKFYKKPSTSSVTKKNLFHELYIPKGMSIVQSGQPLPTDITVIEYAKLQYQKQGRGYLDFCGLGEPCFYVPQSYVLAVTPESEAWHETNAFIIHNPVMATLLELYNPEEEIVIRRPISHVYNPRNPDDFVYGIAFSDEIYQRWRVRYLQDFPAPGIQCPPGAEVVLGSVAYWLVPIGGLPELMETSGSV